MIIWCDILALIFALAGLAMLLRPEDIYRVLQSWKNDSPSGASDRYLREIRFKGVFYLVVGVVLGVLATIFL